MQPKVPWWVTASLLASALVSLVSLAFRFKVEASNRAVGILIESQTVHDIASAVNKPYGEVLAALASHGLTGVALSEENVSDLVDRGEVNLGPHVSGGIGISGRIQSMARIAMAIARRGGMGSNPGNSDNGTIVFNGDTRSLKSLSVGLDPQEAAEVKKNGLVIVARHGNVIGAGPTYIRETLEASKELGATAYLPSGDQVLGQRTSIEDTALALTDLGMEYLTPEFAKLGGDAKLSSKIPERTLRVHSMQQAEIDKSSPGAVVERYTKAFRERNVRWLLVRPLSLGGQDPMAQTQTFFDDLRASVVKEGGAVKPPRPFKDPEVPRLVFLLIGLVAAPWLFWTGTTIVTQRTVQIVGLVVSVLLGASCWIEAARPYAALAFGVFAPVAAYQIFFRRAETSKVLASYVLVSAISLVGGLTVAGLLNGLPYLLEVKQALGVKAILMVPIVFAGWIAVNAVTTPKKVASTPINWGPLLAGLVLLAAVAFLVVRSGNDAPSAVSESEIKFRAILDKVFYTRPRTKEILIGHPAFLIGLFLWKRAKAQPQFNSWAAIALAIGMIGQSDIVDTLCHTHTPLDIGLARIVIGLIVGGIIGWAVWMVLNRFLPKAGDTA